MANQTHENLLTFPTVPGWCAGRTPKPRPRSLFAGKLVNGSVMARSWPHCLMAPLALGG